jgi:hypothetical protein
MLKDECVIDRLAQLAWYDQAGLSLENRVNLPCVPVCPVCSTFSSPDFAPTICCGASLQFHDHSLDN